MWSRPLCGHPGRLTTRDRRAFPFSCSSPPAEVDFSRQWLQWRRFAAPIMAMNLATNIDLYATDPTMVAKSRKLTSLLGWSVEITVMPVQSLVFTNGKSTHLHGNPVLYDLYVGQRRTEVFTQYGRALRKVLRVAVRCVKCSKWHKAWLVRTLSVV